jgi:hypothetical protein
VDGALDEAISCFPAVSSPALRTTPSKVLPQVFQEAPDCSLANCDTRGQVYSPSGCRQTSFFGALAAQLLNFLQSTRVTVTNTAKKIDAGMCHSDNSF